MDRTHIPHPDNPRRISKAQLSKLDKWIEKYGELSSITINRRTNHIVSGNQRDKIIGISEAPIEIINERKKPDKQGTVLNGYIIHQGKRYIYREVEWDEETERRAMIIANKAGGTWDKEKLSKFSFKALNEAGFEQWEHHKGYETTEEDDTTTNKGGRRQLDELPGYIKGNTKKIEIIGRPKDLAPVKRALKKHTNETGATRAEAAIEILKQYIHANNRD